MKLDPNRRWKRSLTGKVFTAQQLTNLMGVSEADRQHVIAAIALGGFVVTEDAATSPELEFGPAATLAPTLADVEKYVASALRPGAGGEE